MATLRIPQLYLSSLFAYLATDCTSLGFLLDGPTAICSIYLAYAPIHILTPMVKQRMTISYRSATPISWTTQYMPYEIYPIFSLSIC